MIERGDLRTYCNRNEEDSRSREEVCKIHILPNRIVTPGSVSVDTHLGIKPEVFGELQEDLRVCFLCMDKNVDLLTLR